MFIALGGGVVLVSGAAAYLRLSPLLTGFFFGIALVNTTREPAPVVSALRRVEEPLYYMLLLFGGAGWRPSERAWLAPVVLFVLARVLAKIGGSRLAARANGAMTELGPHWGRATLGQGRLALAIGLNFVHPRRRRRRRRRRSRVAGFATGMRDVLPMTDSLRAELPRMLEEHKTIRAATERLGEGARAEKNSKLARLAEQLMLHARSEEEVFYPAVLVGDLVRARPTGASRP